MITTGRRASSSVLAVLVVILAACGSAGTPNAPSHSANSSVAPSPSPAPTSITSALEAGAAVVVSDPRFAGIVPKDPNLIGQCCFSTARATATGYEVTIEVGWGDCESGCIDRHHWIYSVTPDGSVRLEREDGAVVPAGVPGTGGSTTSGSVPPGVIGIRGIATAGPTCPVVTPGDPNCADRPVAGATIHVIDDHDTEVAVLETDANGAFVVTLAPGRYTVVPDPVTGFMHPAAPVDVTVTTTLADVVLSYDTGIR